MAHHVHIAHDANGWLSRSGSLSSTQQVKQSMKRRDDIALQSQVSRDLLCSCRRSRGQTFLFVWPLVCLVAWSCTCSLWVFVSKKKWTAYLCSRPRGHRTDHHQQATKQNSPTWTCWPRSQASSSSTNSLNHWALRELWPVHLVSPYGRWLSTSFLFLSP